MNDRPTFGEWLRLRRKALDLTQEQLADQAGCSPNTVRKMESGQRRPSRQMVEVLARSLRVPADQLAALTQAARSSAMLESPLPVPVSPVLPHGIARPIVSWPSLPTNFVGRHKELATVRTMLLDERLRLLTLTGPGGSGKTRLAVEATSDLREQFGDGAFFVSLAPIRDPALVLATIARTLSVQEAPGESLLGTLKKYLAFRHVLLFLDNFEQVVEAAPEIGHLVNAAPRLKVLVTSREPLRLYGEQLFPVPPLELPDAEHLPVLEILTDYEAVRLFIDRARLVKHDFAVTPENAPAVAGICARLDGMPLAIELAAAQARTLPPQSLLVRLSGRLKLLTRGARDLPTRQQTLQGTIQWSYDLLTEEEKRLFRSLAVFQGGRTLEAIESVCNYDAQLGPDIVAGVESLLSKSLLDQKEGRNSEPRFWMLETIHEFAREKLEESGEVEELHTQHALFFLQLAEESESYLTGSRQVEWLNRLQDEHDNFRAALAWSLANASNSREALKIGLTVTGAVGRFWDARGYWREGLDYIQAFLKIVGEANTHIPPTGDPSGEDTGLIIAKNMNHGSWLAARLGDYPTARAMGESALALATELGDKPGMGTSLTLLGSVAGDEEDHALARSLYKQGLAIRRELGDKRGVAAILVNLGGLAYEEGNYSEARGLWEQSLGIQLELEDKIGMPYSLSGLGTTAYWQGDYESARSFFQQAIHLCDEVGNPLETALNLTWLGNVAWREGDRALARSVHEQALEIFKTLGYPSQIGHWYYRQGLWAYEDGEYAAAHSLFLQGLSELKSDWSKRGTLISLTALGGVAAGLGQAERAARLLGAGEALFTALGQVLEPDDRLPYEQGLAAARLQLGEQAFEIARQEGRAMTIEQAVAYALDES